MARNTTIIRSNYLWDESSAIYEHSLKLWEGLEEELDYPILFSQRGVLNLAHSLQDVRDSVRRVEANKLNGIDAEWLDPDEVKKVCPIVNISQELRYPVLGATYQPRAGIAKHDYVAWGFARRADEAGVDLIQDCEVTGFITDGDRVTGVRTTRGDIAAGQVALCAAGTPRCWPTCSALRPADAEPPAAGAGVRAARAGAPDRGDVQRRARVRVAGAQGRAGDGRRASTPTTATASAARSTSSSGRWPPRWSCSRSSPAPTCCAPGRGIVDVSPDASPIVGLTPYEGLYLNCGWGTGGFKAHPGRRLVPGAHDRHTTSRTRTSRRSASTGSSPAPSIDEHGAAGVAH